MSNNPCPAFPHTSCDVCGEEMEEGDHVFFHEGDKYCELCAEDINIVCECGQYKKPEYETCYECKEKNECV